jgi:hypothetical protein
LTRPLNFGTTKREGYSYDANNNRLKLEQRTNKAIPTLTTLLTSTITTGTNLLATVSGGTNTRQLSYKAQQQYCGCN